MSLTIDMLPEIPIPSAPSECKFDAQHGLPASWADDPTAPWYGNVGFVIETPRGHIDVSAGYNRLLCRGAAEAIIAYGLVLPEWMPGLPGNNATAQMVVFEEDGPRLLLGKSRRGKRPTGPRVIIRAWGFVQRTAEVTIPMTEAQQEQLAALNALIAQQNTFRQHREAFGHRQEATTQDVYRHKGNVVYLFGTAERRATP